MSSLTKYTKVSIKFPVAPHIFIVLSLDPDTIVSTFPSILFDIATEVTSSYPSLVFTGGETPVRSNELR